MTCPLNSTLSSHALVLCSAYYVIGGGVKAAILQENVAATNGIVHYIDRVLGVPYQTMFEVIRNESQLQYVSHVGSLINVAFVDSY